MLLLAPAALAFDLQEVATVPLASAATRLVPAPLDGGRYVLVVGPDAVEVVEHEGRATVGSVGRGARDVLQRDPDRDGIPELWLCADDGVWRVPWPAVDTFEAPVQVRTEACAAFAPFGGHLGGLVVSGDALVRWYDDGAGSLVDGVDIGGALDPVVMASDGETAVVAAAGGGVLTIVRGSGTEEVDAGGRVGGVALVGGLPAWSLGDSGTITDIEGILLTVADGPGALATVDLDGDGAEDLAVHHPASDFVGVVRVEAEERFELAGWSALVGVAGAPCGAIWGLDESGTNLRIATAVDCGAELDDDGDGYTPADGDCDDADATTWPGAAPGCDGRDHDCDGVVEWEPGDWLPSEVAVLEGTTAKMDLDAACFDDVDVTWAVPTDPRIGCIGFGGGLWCTGVDDVVASASADVWTEDGVLLDHREVALTVVNVAPRLDPNIRGTFSDDNVTVTAGIQFSERVRAEDPGDDVVRIAIRDAPPGLRMDDQGNVTWTPSEDEVGTCTPTLLLADEDGGIDTHTFTLTVVDGGDGGACCSSSAALLLLLLTRPRRRAAR